MGSSKGGGGGVYIHNNSNYLLVTAFYGHFSSNASTAIDPQRKINVYVKAVAFNPTDGWLRKVKD